MSKLAILGGDPIIKKPLSYYTSIGKEEAAAVSKVMQSGRISEFIGAWCDEFYGGPLIQEFESLWSAEFDCKHSISVNSNTSGLIAAMGAVVFRQAMRLLFLLGLCQQLLWHHFSMAVSQYLLM